MKILLIQHLSFINGSGGTEKICSFLANHFCDLGYDVEVATNENIQGKEVYPLNEKIKLTNIYSPDIEQVSLKNIYRYKGKNPFHWLKYKIKREQDKIFNKKILKKFGGEDGIYTFNLRQRAKAWKKFIEQSKPNLIITMSVGSVLEITYGNDLQIPIINSTNGRPDYDYTDILWYRSPIDMQCLENSYKKIDTIQVLFENYKNFLPKSFSGNSVVIGNPMPQTSENEKVNHLLEKEKYKITHIGSLNTDCKQQDLAIKIFSKLTEKFSNWELHFWGVGADKNKLEKLIEKYHLRQKIFLNGFTSNALKELQKSDIFIFPSKYEGFPLALGEAMSVGLPCLGMADCSGVNQMIKHGENGFLAQNEEELTEFLEKLMENPTLRQEMGTSARNFTTQFSPEKIAKQWEDLVVQTLNKN